MKIGITIFLLIVFSSSCIQIPPERVNPFDPFGTSYIGNGGETNICYGETNISPYAVITFPLDGGNTDSTVRVYAYDEDGSIDRVELYKEGSYFLGSRVYPPYEFSVSSIKGTYIIHAKVYDNEGCITESPRITVTFN